VPVSKRARLKRVGKARPRPAARRLRLDRLDPTRTATLRRAFETTIKQGFAKLRLAVADLVAKEDAFGLTQNAAAARLELYRPYYVLNTREAALKAWETRRRKAAERAAQRPAKHFHVTVEPSPPGRPTVEQLLPRLTPDDIAAVCGGMDGARVSIKVGRHSDDVLVYIDHDRYHAERTIDPASMSIHNDIIRVTGGRAGFGTQVFKDQVDAAAAHGFKHIECLAARAPGIFNGYVTWAKMGYDGDLAGQPSEIKDYAQARGYTRVSDFMKTKEGRDHWEQHGRSWNAEFDLRAGSQNRKALDAYHAKKFPAGRVFNAPGRGAAGADGGGRADARRGLGRDRQGEPARLGWFGVSNALVELPNVRQPDHYSCGAAVAMSVGLHYGAGPRTLDGWKQLLGTSKEKSTAPQALVEAFSQLGCSVIAQHGLTLEDLEHFTELGLPVICCLKDYMPSMPAEAEFDYGHYVAVIGVGDGYVFAQDPSADNAIAGGHDKDPKEEVGALQAPGRVMIRQDDWLENWYDEDEEGRDYVRFGIVVGPPDRITANDSEAAKKAWDTRGRAHAVAKGEMFGHVYEVHQNPSKEQLDNWLKNLGRDDKLYGMVADDGKNAWFWDVPYDPEAPLPAGHKEVAERILDVDVPRFKNHFSVVREKGEPVVKSYAGGKGSPALRQWLEGTGITANVTANRRFAFERDPQKLQAFQAWLKSQFATAVNLEDAWKKFMTQGFAKGAGRAFDDVRQQALRQKHPEYFTQTAQDVLKPFYEGTKEEFLRSAFEQPVAQEKVDLLADRAFDELQGITDQMSTRMSGVLADGMVQGKSPREVARDLDKQVQLGRDRALTIARTEIIRAHAEGQLTALENLGVEQVGVAVEWSTTGDEKVCEACAALEGIVLKIDEARGLIPRHPRCRCAWIPANVGEPDVEQVRSKADIEDALEESEGAQGDDLDVDVAGERPVSIFNQRWYRAVVANALRLLGPPVGRRNRAIALLVANTREASLKAWDARGRGRMEAREKSLRQGKIVHEELIAEDDGGGINDVYRVRLKDGSEGAWKPKSGEDPDARYNIRRGTYYQREAAAYDVAKAIGMTDLVPATVVREHQGQKGSLQEWVRNAVPMWETPRFRDAFGGNRDLARAAAYDVLIGNTDRHPGNWLIKDGKKLRLIDNGLAFPREDDAEFLSYLDREAKKTGVKVPKEVLGWDGDKVARAMKKNGLEDSAVDLMRQRLARLKTKAQRGSGFKGAR